MLRGGKPASGRRPQQSGVFKLIAALASRVRSCYEALVTRPDAPDVPEHGGRVLFVLTHQDAERAEYRVTLLVDEREYAAVMTFHDGASELSAWDSEPPAWMEKSIRGFARQLTLKRKELGKWPRRLLRWRKSK